jgi:HEAT repeat protein
VISTSALRSVLALLLAAAIAGVAVGAPVGGPGKPPAAAGGKTEKPAASHSRQAKGNEAELIANPNAGPELTSWLSNLEEANRRALADRKPLLIVAGAKWCGACRELATELHAAAVQAELARWTPVYIDIDAQPAAATQLGVVGVPALRIRAAGGQQLAKRDGFLTADALVAWMKENFEAATAAADDSLLSTGPPGMTAVVRLVRQFRQRNPALREAAVRRLAPYPELTRPLVLKTFLEGSLTARLAALEVLEQWKAPLAELDPWRPETFTPKRVARLEKWGEREMAAGRASPPKELSAEQLADARRQIDRMLGGDEGEADATGQRLAGLGAALLPEVYVRLRTAATDQQRRRLLVLRYRLVATDALVLRWPGGLERLADPDPRQRRQAADELAKLAGDGENALLLELFADPDPLVREIGLRGLQHVGGAEANAALVKLLGDPEPNVRAAVLKQLEELPDPAMVSAVVKYLKQEKDPDLVVHAIAFLGASKSSEAIRALMSLLKHERWQVRAEAAAGIGKHGGEGPWMVHGPVPSLANESDAATKLQVDAYVALLDLLDDKDSFVVAKAVEGLGHADLAVAVEPLARAAERHPDLASSVLGMLAGGGKMRAKAIPHLRKFCKHEKAGIRAAAIAALESAASTDIEQELLAAINDKEGEVRTAAAQALLMLMDQSRQAGKNKPGMPMTSVPSAVSVDVDLPPSVSQIVVSKVLEAFRGAISSSGPPKAATVVKPGSPVKAKDEADDPDAWIKQCYAGRHRPAWTAQMVAPLEKMSRSAAAKERVAAALALAPLGKPEAATRLLLETVRANPELTDAAAGVLPWLCLPQRVSTFHALSGLAPNADGRAHLIARLSAEADRRLADVMWELLADPHVTEQVAGSLHNGLMMAYLGRQYFAPTQVPASDRRELAKAAKPRAILGGPWQRRVALVLLATAAPDEASEVAAKLADDAKLADPLRADAFQIRMITQPGSEATKLAVAAMKGSDPARKKLGLKYLVHGPNELRSMGHGLYLHGTMDASFYNNPRGVPIVPKPPAGVAAEDVRPLAGSSDAETAASAGYLLAVMGEAEGIGPLVQYWRQHEASSNQWRRLVYRAIAVIDDPKYIAVLREIYGKLQDYEISEFYWTIRIMSGPEILKFRKQIRDEKGAQLR